MAGTSARSYPAVSPRKWGEKYTYRNINRRISSSSSTDHKSVSGTAAAWTKEAAAKHVAAAKEGGVVGRKMEHRQRGCSTGKEQRGSSV